MRSPPDAPSTTFDNNSAVDRFDHCEPSVRPDIARWSARLPVGLAKFGQEAADGGRYFRTRIHLQGVMQVFGGGSLIVKREGNNASVI